MKLKKVIFIIIVIILASSVLFASEEKKNYRNRTGISLDYSALSVYEGDVTSPSSLSFSVQHSFLTKDNRWFFTTELSFFSLNFNSIINGYDYNYSLYLFASESVGWIFKINDAFSIDLSVGLGINIFNPDDGCILAEVGALYQFSSPIALKFGCEASVSPVNDSVYWTVRPKIGAYYLY